MVQSLDRLQRVSPHFLDDGGKNAGIGVHLPATPELGTVLGPRHACMTLLAPVIEALVPLLKVCAALDGGNSTDRKRVPFCDEVDFWIVTVKLCHSVTREI